MRAHFERIPSTQESAAPGLPRRVPCPVQDADNDKRIGEGSIVDGISTMEGDAEAVPERLARRCRKRKISHRFHSRLDRRDESRGDFLRCLGRNVRPDVREILFGGLGDAEG